MAGVDLPVEPMRRMLIPTEPFAGVSHEIPMVIDMTNGFHFRPESLGFLLAWNDPEENGGEFNTNFEPSFIEKMLTAPPTACPASRTWPSIPRRHGRGCTRCRPTTTASSGRSEELKASSAPMDSAVTA